MTFCSDDLAAKNPNDCGFLPCEMIYLGSRGKIVRFVGGWPTQRGWSVIES